MHRIFLDANILLDLLLTRPKDAAYVLTIVQQIEAGRLKGYLTTSIIHILGYWLSKEWGATTAKKGLLILLDHFDVLNSDKKTLLSALHSEMSDIEDSLQYYTCLESNLDAIISRDKQFIRSAIPGLPVFSPQDFVRTFIEG